MGHGSEEQGAVPFDTGAVGSAAVQHSEHQVSRARVVASDDFLHSRGPLLPQHRVPPTAPAHRPVTELLVQTVRSSRQSPFVHSEELTGRRNVAPKIARESRKMARNPAPVLQPSADEKQIAEDTSLPVVTSGAETAVRQRVRELNVRRRSVPSNDSLTDGCMAPAEDRDEDSVREQSIMLETSCARLRLDQVRHL